MEENINNTNSVSSVSENPEATGEGKKKAMLMAVAVAMFVVLVTISWANFTQEEEPEVIDPVAVVEGKEISRDEWKERLYEEKRLYSEDVEEGLAVSYEEKDPLAKKWFQYRVLGRMVEEEMLKQYAENHNIDYSEEELKTEVKNIQTYSENVINEATENQDLDDNEVVITDIDEENLERIAEQSLLRRKVFQDIKESAIEVTEEKIEERFEEKWKRDKEQEISPELKDLIRNNLESEKLTQIRSEALKKLKKQTNYEIFIAEPPERPKQETEEGFVTPEQELLSYHFNHYFQAHRIMAEERLPQIAERIESRIGEMEEDGEDVADAREHLEAAQERLDDISRIIDRREERIIRKIEELGDTRDTAEIERALQRILPTVSARVGRIHSELRKAAEEL